MESEPLSLSRSDLEPARNPSETQWRELLAKADIAIDGAHPWDMRVNHPDTYDRIMLKRSLGLGESYMDGWWDCAALDEFFYRLLKARINDISIPRFTLLLQLGVAYLRNRQSQARARQVAEKHYDLDNELFSHMLDPTLAYSCGYWREATTLYAAQVDKLDLICRKMELKPGMKVLDIGCGWGSFTWYAASRYGVQVDGITVSTEQQKYAQQRCADLPVNIYLKDYREMTGRYDRIVSVGMFEHVGRKNYREFMHVVQRLLVDSGLALLHTIGENESTNTFDPWINKYIFPNGELPSLAQITRAAERLFVVEDIQNFGPDYDKTLMAWDANFRRAWPLLEHRYDECFYRMWRYYLNCCAAAFRVRSLQLWQFVLSKSGQRERTYHAAR
ncbi:MAG TPA: cyclopropane fatty acyl phospholipid synthase [Spongiibacteraceae bacterium]|nr:cyclopropane fatty acyl phospholipid synthase [Spongiibacteraceae bacterium]